MTWQTLRTLLWQQFLLQSNSTHIFLRKCYKLVVDWFLKKKRRKKKKYQEIPRNYESLGASKGLV